MYGDLLLACSPLSTGMLWAALLGGGFAFLVGGLAGTSRFVGTHFPSGMSLVKYNLFPKLCPTPHTPRALFTHEHHICPRGKHGCAVKFHFSKSEQNVMP